MKTYITVILLLMASEWASAQTWQPLTTDITSQPYDGQSMYGRIAIDRYGTPYVTFYNPKFRHQAPLTKFNGHSWEPVGYEMFYPDLREAQIAIHPNGTPYIVYDSGTVAAWKFNGEDWDPVGNTDESFFVKDIAIDSAGTPYIAYRKLEGDILKIVVVKLVDNKWEPVGQPGFGTVMSSHQIVIAPDGKPWVAAQGGGVWRFDGTAWQRAGTPESLEKVNYPRLAFAPDGTPYLADGEAEPKNARVLRLTDNEWEVVGNQSFPLGSSSPEIAIDAEGTLYLAFSDDLKGDKATVMRFKDGTWENAGNNAFSDRQIDEISIAIDPEGIPFVAYTDVYEGFDDRVYKQRIMKLVGDEWVSLGGTGLTGGFASILSAVTDPNGRIFMAYSYAGNLDFFDSWHKTAVTRFNGSNWEKLGKDHFWNGIENEQIAAGSDGIPYLVYSDSASDLRITVERFISNEWEIVGNAAFTESNVVPSIAIGTDNKPIVAYVEPMERDAIVKRFDGSAWEHVGPPVVADSAVSLEIAVDKAGTLHVAYIDLSNNLALTVKKFNGTQWEMVGVGDLLAIDYQLFLSIDPFGTPYVVYGNFASATIARFNGTTWETLNLEGMPPKLIFSHIVFDTAGRVYVAFADPAHINKASVYRYNGSSWEPFGNTGFTRVEPWQLQLLSDHEDNFYVIYNREGLFAYQYIENCMNPTTGGTIEGSQQHCGAFDPAAISSSSMPLGATGTLEYLWQRSIISSGRGFTDIQHDAATYDPSLVTQTTWFRRLAIASCMTDWTGAAKSDVVKINISLPPTIHCPPDDTVFNDPGSMSSRLSYSALPEETPDTMAVYLVKGQPIAFPYDFPIGITEVEVKASCSNAIETACSFKVIVKQMTGTRELDTFRPTVDIYPNPFTREIAIEVSNPSHSAVSAAIYNLSGQKIKSLAWTRKDAKISLAWDGSNEQGKQVPEGVYILKVNEMRKKVVKGD